MVNEYRRFLLLLILCFYSIIIVFSQNESTITGNVSIEDGPAIGAQIVNMTTMDIVAVTDTIGNFSFKSLYEDFKISFLGYEDYTFSLDEDKALQVILVSKSSLLNQVVVSENRRESAIKNATVSMESIKPEIIANTASITIDDVLGRLSGVQIVDQQPNIRSGSGWSYGAGSRVQVMVNDMPILSGDAGQPLWSFVPTEGVSSIEIMKGAASVIYGSSALNGVINIKTKKPGLKPYSEVTSSFGIYDLPQRESLDYNGGKRKTVSNLTAYHSGIYKDVGYTFSINALDDNGYKMGDYDKRIRAAASISKTFTEKNLQVGLNTSVQSGNSGSFLLWESLDLGYTTLDSGITKSNTTRFVIDPYVKIVKGNVSHTLNTRYLRVGNEVDNGDSTSNQSNFSDLFYAEYRNQLKFKKLGLNILSGVVYSYSVTESPIFNGRQMIRNTAGYIQIDKKWNKLIWTGGVRYQDYKLNDRKDSKPVLRSGLNYELTKYTFIRASYGEGYRFPSIAESYITTSVGPVSIYPNDSLVPETGSNLELGIKQGFKIKKVNFMADVAIYQMNFDNMMEFTFGQWGNPVPPLFGIGFRTTNTGKVRIRGLETTVGFEHKNEKWEFQGFVGYNYSLPISLEPDKIFAVDNQGTPLSYQNTSYNDSLNILKYRPQHLIKSDVMIQYKKFKVGVGYTFQSQMLNLDRSFIDVPIGFFVPGIEESYIQQLTEHHLVNIRVGYNFTDKLFCNAIISNITNREYAVRPADLGAPRSFRLQIAYRM